MNNLTFADVLQQAVDSILSTVHTCLPGKIEKYDYETQKADVKPLLKRKFEDGDIIELPVLTDVPVIMPRSSKASIMFPIKKGDLVLLLFSERAIGDWLINGGLVDPISSRRFDLSDAIAIPGLYPFTEKSPAQNADDLQIKNDESTITLRQDGTMLLEGKGTIEMLSSGTVEINGSNLTVDK